MLPSFAALASIQLERADDPEQRRSAEQ